MNWLNYLDGQMEKGDEVRVYSFDVPAGFKKFETSSSFIRIFRYGKPIVKNAFYRYRNYWAFYKSVTINLKTWRPDTILYYETLSALPAFVYRKFINRRSRILIHYHEYTTIAEYRDGMKINDWSHQLERKLYPYADWVSHTNPDRMRLFKADEHAISITNPRILPNYPPSSWKSEKREKSMGSPVKFIFLGSLSLDTMYIREFADWIVKQHGMATLDIYSGNITSETLAYLKEMGRAWIHVYGQVDYFSLPDLLKNYDIGVVLYKGHIPNYIFNAPNKLFEYWICGLDVWFPQKMESSLPYVTKGVYPKIIPVDFENPDSINLSVLKDRTGFTYQAAGYAYEPEYRILLEQIKHNQQ